MRCLKHDKKMRRRGETLVCEDCLKDERERNGATHQPASRADLDRLKAWASS